MWQHITHNCDAIDSAAAAYPAAIDDAEIAQAVGVQLAVIIAHERDGAVAVAVALAVPRHRALALVGELLLRLAVQQLEETQLNVAHVVYLKTQSKEQVTCRAKTCMSMLAKKLGSS